MVTIGESFEERMRKSLVEAAVVEEVYRAGPSTKDDLGRRIPPMLGLGPGVDEDFVASCIKRLDSDGVLSAKAAEIVASNAAAKTHPKGEVHLTDKGIEVAMALHEALSNLAENEREPRRDPSPTGIDPDLPGP